MLVPLTDEWCASNRQFPASRTQVVVSILEIIDVANWLSMLFDYNLQWSYRRPVNIQVRRNTAESNRRNPVSLKILILLLIEGRTAHVNTRSHHLNYFYSVLIIVSESVHL